MFWVFASNAARVEAAYREIANTLLLPGRNESTANVIQLVAGWLANENNGRWLMIIDNMDDLDTLHAEVGSSEDMVSIANMVPQSRNGAVLITSRNIDVVREMVGREQDIVRVGQMEKGEAAELLKKKLVKPLDDSEASLLAALDYFPLAITQAAAYINRQPGMSVSAYVSKLHNIASKTNLLEKHLPDVRRHEKAKSSILKTWWISFEQIKMERPGAAELLSFMSFFNRQGIPKFMFQYYASHFEGDETATSGTSTKGDDDELEEHIAVLHSFSLISTTTKDDEFEMHGLVQFATRAWLNSTEQEGEYWSLYLTALAAAYPQGRYENWAMCRALLPHIQSIGEKTPSSEEHGRAWTQVLTNAGWYTWQQGLLSQARGLIELSLGKCEQLYGANDDKTLLNLDILAGVLQDQGKYEESEAMNRWALAGREEKLGEDHPGTLASVSNLASVLWYQGKYEESEAMNRRALAWREKELGEDHPSTLTSVNNLAVMLQYQGKYEESEALNRQALAGWEEKLGEDHPSTLASVSNLASVLRYQGKYEESEALNRRVLVGREEKLGEDHPYTLTSVNSLALVLQYQGKYEESEAMNRRALVGREEKLGEDHPETLTSVNNLALVLQYQGKYEESEALNRQALAGWEEKLGEDHPSTLTSVNNLASVLQYQGKYEESEAMNRRALVGREDKLGEDHPETLTSVSNLASVLQYQGRYEESEAMNRRGAGGVGEGAGRGPSFDADECE